MDKRCQKPFLDEVLIRRAVHGHGSSVTSCRRGPIYHVLNRANGRLPLFETPADYEAFEQMLGEAHDRFPMRTLAHCLMPNLWHLVLWPQEEGQVGGFMRRLTTTHVRRWHLHRQSVGAGHLYQGTHKSFPIQKDEHLLSVCRYVESNPVRVKLAERAEEWPWSSLWQRLHQAERRGKPSLSEWPVAQPADWLEWVNRPETPAELEAMRSSATQDRPYRTPS